MGRQWEGERKEERKGGRNEEKEGGREKRWKGEKMRKEERTSKGTKELQFRNENEGRGIFLVELFTGTILTSVEPTKRS